MPGIDREADILPWGSPPEVKKVSPVEASASYLRHIRDAWNDAFAQDDPSKRLESQEVVLTVPASFDEAARELTIEAAKRAELATITLARGAAGGVLLLDRLAPGPLAARGARRRADPGLRHRRRHDRLQLDHGRRDADRPRVSPRRRRRSPDAGRRQHRPRAGPSRREKARRTHGSTPSSGVHYGSPAGRPRKSCWASSSRPSSAGRSRSPAGARS